MQTKLSTACLTKMLSNATWAWIEAVRHDVKPLIEKYGAICVRLRNTLALRIEDKMRGI